MFIIIGIGLIIGGYFSINNSNEKNNTYIKVVGRVINHDYKYDSDDKTTYASIVEYTVNGERYTSTSSVYSSFKETIGTEVRLKYNPNDPSEVIWVNDHSNFVLFLVGGIFIVGGVGILINSKRLNKKNSNIDNNGLNELTQQENGLYNNPDIFKELDTNVSQNTNNNNQNNINI